LGQGPVRAPRCGVHGRAWEGASTPNFQSPTPKARPTPNFQALLVRRSGPCWEFAVGSALDVGDWRLGIPPPTGGGSPGGWRP
jgi:hypothetical protein